MSTPFQALDDLFKSELYLYFHEEVLDEERTAKECTFIEQSCKIEVEAHHQILDLACGHGRHANYFAEKGLGVCGVDINKQFIDIAKAAAANKQLVVDYIEQDILKINYQERFDHVLLLFNTLGFFDRDDCRTLFQRMYMALRIGGKAFIDTKNKDHIIKEILPCSVVEKNDDLMIDRLSFNPRTGTTINKRIYIKDGKRYDAPFTMTLYNYIELEHLADEFNFKINQVWGSWKGEEFNQDSRRIILVLEKIK